MSSTTSTVSTPAVSSRTSPASSGQGMPSCTTRRPSASQLALAQAEVVERAQHGLVGHARGHDGRARARGARDDHAVQAGHAARTGAPAPAAGSSGRARRPGSTGGSSTGGSNPARGGSSGSPARARGGVDGGAGVGDVGHDLQPGPQPAVARQGDGVQAERDQLGDRAGRQHAAPSGCGTSARTSWARSRTWRPGRRRSAPPPRRAGRCRTRLPWRMASAARSRPGLLPYQNPVTPSWRRPSSSPQQLGAGHGGGGQLLVQARAGRRCRPARVCPAARASSLSSPPSGEPW